MYHKQVFVWIGTVLLQAVNLQNVERKAATSGAYDLVFSKIESRLNIASKILDSARREMKDELNQICRNSSCSGRSVDCNKWRRHQLEGKPTDCGDIYKDGYNKSGIYQIWPQSKISVGPLHVYCDMEDGGGWTVIQRRGDFGNSGEYFYQDWNAYKIGFGHLLREFWIGNDNLFALTSQKIYQLKVDMRNWEQEEIKYATYSKFWIDDEIHNYALHLGTYEGTAGDSFQRQNGSDFSTKDRDNDSNTGDSCANSFKGAWWYSYCMDSNLNGPYGKPANVTYGMGLIWKTLKGFSYSLKDAVMKLRAADFENGVNSIVN